MILDVWRKLALTESVTFVGFLRTLTGLANDLRANSNFESFKAERRPCSYMTLRSGIEVIRDDALEGHIKILLNLEPNWFLRVSIRPLM